MGGYLGGYSTRSLDYSSCRDIVGCIGLGFRLGTALPQ